MAWNFYRPNVSKVSIRTADGDKQSTFEGITASNSVTPQQVADGINILAGIVDQGNYVVNEKMQRTFAEEVVDDE